jgi:hypothetical protein
MVTAVSADIAGRLATQDAATGIVANAKAAVRERLRIDLLVPKTPMSAMGRKRTLALGLLRQLLPAPWTVRNPYHALAPIMNDDAVGFCGGPEINQAIGTLMPFRMFVASRGDVPRHGFAAVLGHAATIARRIDVRNGWRAVIPKLPFCAICGHDFQCRPVKLSSARAGPPDELDFQQAVILIGVK